MAFDDFFFLGGGVQNLAKNDDVILEHSLTIDMASF